LFDQVVLNCSFASLFPLSLGVGGLIAFFIIDFNSKKPKVEFGEPYLGTGLDSDFCWYIQVQNLKNNRWWSPIFKQREAAIDCRVKVRFTKVDGKLIYNYALWWDNSLIGETLEVGSKPHEFPLAFEDAKREIHLAGTPITTGSSPIPNYRLPFPIDVIAYVELSSKKKVIAKSKWLIEVKHSQFTPINVKRLEEGEL